MVRKHWIAVVLVVCGLSLAVTWAMVPRPAEKRPEDQAAAELAKIGATVIRDPQQPGKPIIHVRLPRTATDADLKELALLSLPKFTTLDLGGTQVTEAALKELAPLQSLTTLKPPGLVTDGVLRSLREAGLLHALTGAVAAGGHRPARPEHVVKLDLSDTKVTEAGIAELAPLKNLTTLLLPTTKESWHYGRSIGGTQPRMKVTDGVVRSLSKIGLLHAVPVATAAWGKRPARPEHVLSLDLGWSEHSLDDRGGKWDLPSPVGDAGLAELAKFTKLTTLMLPCDKVTDAGLAEVAKLKYLTRLDLCQNEKVTHAGFAELAKITSLTTLNLESTKVTDAGLKQLAPLKNLTTLNLRGTEVTDLGLKALAPLKKLNTLHLPKSESGPWPSRVETDDVLRSLGEIGLLHALTCATAVGDKRPARPEDVVSFILAWNEKVTDVGIAELAPLTNLTQLNLAGTKVTDAGLAKLASLTNLTSLYLYKTKVTAKGVAELQKALPKCNIWGWR